MKKRDIKIEAQNKVLCAVVAAALSAEESGDSLGAEAIRDLGSSMARRWGVEDVPGLPATYRSRESA